MRFLTNAGCVALIFVHAGFAQVAGTASISGQIVSAVGHPVRAIVSLQFSGPRRFPSASRRTFTAQDGTFAFQRLTPGQYLVCAQIPQSEGARSAAPFLDTCSWGSSQGPIPLAAGQQLVGITFAAPKGALLQVRINDPGQVLPQAVSAIGPSPLEPEIQVVVRGSDRRAHHAQFVSKDAGGRNYQIVIPLNTALGLTVSSTVGNVLDSTGSPIQAEVGLQPATGATLNPVAFTVQRKAN